MATAWEVDTAVYEEKYKSVSLQDTQPYGVFFGPDGTKMYMLGYTSDKVFQYLLSAAWDVPTASYTNKFKYVGTQDTATQSLFFKPDGSKMYIIGTLSAKVFQYALSTLWDVDTASYEDKYKDVQTTPRGLSFKPDGSKMYILSGGKVYQYLLSTSWDVETAVYDEKFKDTTAQNDVPVEVSFKPDGTKMYMVGVSGDKVFQYSLSTAWSVDTATYEDKFKYVGDEETSPWGLFFKPDGAKMYIVGTSADKVFQYDLPVAPPVGQPFALRRRGRMISLGGVR